MLRCVRRWCAPLQRGGGGELLQGGGGTLHLSRGGAGRELAGGGSAQLSHCRCGGGPGRCSCLAAQGAPLSGVPRGSLSAAAAREAIRGSAGGGLEGFDGGRDDEALSFFGLSASSFVAFAVGWYLSRWALRDWNHTGQARGLGQETDRCEGEHTKVASCKYDRENVTLIWVSVGDGESHR
eukprot:1194623-Prorocentrum_minimum.AAC.2